MTPRIPRGWVVATERGEGVWCAHGNAGSYVPAGCNLSEPMSPMLTYIIRTAPSVPADPNECLRLEDEAAVSERQDYAGQMVPGMMRMYDGTLLALCAIARLSDDRTGQTIIQRTGGDPGDYWIDDRTPAEFAAAYTAAWEYTERRKVEIAEDVRRAGAPSTAPDLGEWPGRADVPPDDDSPVEVLTQHGQCLGTYSEARKGWFVLAGIKWKRVGTVEVMRWRRVVAIVADRRVTGVTRG